MVVGAFVLDVSESDVARDLEQPLLVLASDVLDVHVRSETVRLVWRLPVAGLSEIEQSAVDQAGVVDI